MKLGVALALALVAFAFAGTSRASPRPTPPRPTPPRPGPRPAPRPGPSPGPRPPQRPPTPKPGPRGPRAVQLVPGKSYALTFQDAKEFTLSEAKLVDQVLDSVHILAMAELPGSPAPGDPTHVKAKALAPTRIEVPLYFQDDRVVYLADIVALDAAIPP